MYGRTFFFVRPIHHCPQTSTGWQAKRHACKQASADASYTSHGIACINALQLMYGRISERMQRYSWTIYRCRLVHQPPSKGFGNAGPQHQYMHVSALASRAHIDVCTEKHCHIRISCMRGCASFAPFACVAQASCVTESRHMYMYDGSSAYVRIYVVMAHTQGRTYACVCIACSFGPVRWYAENRRRHTLFFSAIQPSCTGTISARALTCISLVTLTDIHMRVRPQACMHAHMCVSVRLAMHLAIFMLMHI